MNKLVEKLAAAGHLNADQVDRIQSTVAAFEKLAVEDPEFHREAIEKISGFGKTLGDTAKMMGGTMLIAGAANVIGDVYRHASDAVMKAHRYKKMVEENPDLHDADSKMLQQAFSTLHRFNPTYASDPSVAGQFVRQQIERQGMDFTQLKNIVDTGKTLRESRGPGIAAHMAHPAVASGMVQWPSPDAPKKEEELGTATANRQTAEARLRRQQEVNRRFQMPEEE